MVKNQQLGRDFRVFKKLKCNLLALLFSAACVYAIDYTWDISTAAGTQAGSGTWGTDSYWSTDGTTLSSWPGAGNSATFAGADGSYTITVSGTQSVDSLSFLNDGYSFSGGTSIDLGTGSGIYVAAAAFVFVNTPVSGTGGLVKNGAGVLHLVGECTYTGNTTINEGILAIGNSTTTGSVTGNIIVNDTLYFNRSDDITFSGDISGTGELYKHGAGSLTLTGTLTHTGGTHNADGTGLIIGDGGNSGSIVSDIINDVPLIFNRADTVTYEGVISGAGTVTKSGAGKLVFTSAHTYTGATAINEGILSVNGSIAAGSNVAVNSGGILAGNGSVLGSVTVNTGGSIEPLYDSIGKLTVGSLQMASDGELRFDFGTENDTLAVSGDLVLDGLLTVYEQVGFTAGTYRLMEYSGTLTDNTLEIGTAPAGYTYSITASAGIVELTVTHIPSCEWVGGGGTDLWSNPVNWSGSTVPVSADSVVFLSASYPCSLDVDVTVRCLMFEPGYTQTFYMNNKKLTVLSRLSVNHSGSIVNGGADTICFAGSDPMVFMPKQGMLMPTIHQSGDGVTQVLNDGFTAENLLIANGEFSLGAGYSDSVITQLTVTTGNLNVGDGYLYVNGNADFSQALGITAGYGAIHFSGASQQILIPKNDLTLPNIMKDGAGDLRVQGDRFRASRLDVNTGSMFMDTALTIDTINVMSGTVFKFDSVSINADTIKTLEGYGEVNFGQSDIYADSSLSLNSFTTLTGAGNLIFFGDDTIDFEPNMNYRHNRIEKRGTGYLRISMYGLLTKSAKLNDGYWDWGTSGIDTVSDTLTINGGTMKLTSSSVNVGSFTASGGSLSCNMGSLVSIGGGTLDLSSLTGISPDTGSIRFEGAGASRSFLKANPAGVLPLIEIYGSTTDTVELVTDITGKCFRQYSGVVEWGTGRTHSLDTLGCYGGQMDFGSAAISIAQGDADLSGLSSITAGTGSLHFTASSVIQLLSPPSSLSCPEIVVDGTGTVKINTNPLTCSGLQINSGTFDFSAIDATVSGDMTVVNGSASTFNNLDGIVLTVNGNAAFTGQNGNPLNLNPSTAWTLAVSGSLYADYASIGNCNASITTGQAMNTCVDNGGNTNWMFDTLPPDNDMGLAATGVSLTEVNVTWYPTLVDSSDADSVGVWYKTTDYPDSAYDVSAVFGGIFPLVDSVQTISGLSSHTRYYFAAAVRDSYGNWSDVLGAMDSAFTFADPPTPVTDLDTIHKKAVTCSWNNPSGLSAGDSVYVHHDTVSGAGWLLDTVLDYTMNSCDLTLPLSGEGEWKIMVSTSWDSAGIFHFEDVLVDTFTFDISPPSGITSPDTVHRQLAGITWSNPAGLTAEDSIYLHIDTVTGGALTLDMTLSSSSTSATVDLPASEGAYRYMLSTSLDSAGEYSMENVYLDTILFLIEPPVITTSIDSVESLNPAISWTAPEGMAVGDSFYIAVDTVTGSWGWVSSGVYAYPAVSASLSFYGVGNYMYRVATSWDSLCLLSVDNAAYDTIGIIDTTPPLGVAIMINDNSGYTADSDPSIALAISDADSMRVALAADTGAAVWTVANSSDSIDISAAGEGVVYIYAQFSDSLGNRSEWVIDSTVFDTTSPSGSISVADDNGYTNSSVVSFAVSAANADSMRYGTGSDTATAVWYPYASSASLDISAGGEGEKILFVQFKDFAGNASTWQNDTTVLDVTAPTGSFTIKDNSGYTNDNAPALTISSSGADSMRVALVSDTAGLQWDLIGTADSIDLSTTGEGEKIILLQLKDLAGNLSGWYIDTTVYDTSAPSGTISINDNGGITGDADPLCTVNASGADSMRIALASDTSGSLWKVFSAKDSITISTGGEGQKIVCVQFRDVAGNKSQWYMDTTAYDTTHPSGVMSIVDINGYTSNAMVQLVCTANNTDSMRIGVGADTASSVWKMFSSNDSVTIDATNGVTSYVHIQFADTSGERSDWFTDSTTYDSEPPVTSITLVPGGYTNETWPDSIAGVSADAGSGVEFVMVSIRNNDAATWWNGGGWQNSIYFHQQTTTGVWTVQLADSSLTAGNYTVSVQAVDSCGNVNSVSDSVSIYFTVKDTTPPTYALTVSTVNQGDSIVTVTLNNTAAEAGQMMVGMAFSENDAVAAMAIMPLGDTVLTSGILTDFGWWYVATAQSDTTGNWTTQKLDSVYVKNSLPVVSMVTDTTIDEEITWTYRIQAMDRNGDAILVSAIEKPDGLVFDGSTVSWLPDDPNVGTNTLIISAEDGNGGVTNDTLEITVRNKTEAPALTFQGDSIALEDQLFTATLSVVDPDPADVWSLTDIILPDWITRTDTVLQGTPSDAAVGRDSIIIVVIDSYGLSDTVKQIVTVQNVNDTPVIMTSTCPDTVSENDSINFELTVKDDDADDTLLVFWTKPCLWLSAQVKRHDSLGNRWVVSVKGKPSQSVVGMNSFILSLQDRDRASAQLSDTVFVYDEDDPPEPPSIVKEVAWGAARYSLRSVDDRDTVLLYAVALTSFDDSTCRFTDRSENGSFTFFPLQDGKYRFSAVAIDDSGFTSDTAFDTLTVNGATKFITEDSIWTMFSVPGAYKKEQLTSTKYLLHWDETIEKKQLYHYYRQKHEIENLNPGYGYWRKGSSKDTVVLEPSDIAQRPVTVSLNDRVVGWNQIGCPYPYPVVWNDKDAVIWKWNTATSDFEEGDSVLEPWQAYWIHTESEKDVVVDTVPCFRNGRLAKQKKTWFSGKTNWVMQMILNTSTGRDADNRIGIRPDAQDGYDRFDRPEPPRMLGKAYMFIPHSDWRKGINEYAVDIRRKWEPVNIFEIGITGAEKPENARITFEGYQKDASVYLFMKTADSIVQVDPDKGISVRIDNDPVFQTLFVVDNPQILKTLPLRFSLGNPYPNPFCPATKIRYILPYRWGKNGKLIGDEYVVRMDIFDMRGRKIRNLIHRKMAPGSYETFWDGKCEGGRIVASGHYFCRLQAGTFESVRKMTLLR